MGSTGPPGRLRRHPWLLTLAAWTVLIAVLVVPLLPAASAPFPPCNPGGAINPDPSLLTCPMDDANYEAIAVFLYLVLWAFGILVLVVAFAISRMARRSREGPGGDAAADAPPGP
jgi:hypothetical protein